MTSHTLHIEFTPGCEGYATSRLVCSDNGGPRCADVVRANDCPDLAEWQAAHPDAPRWEAEGQLPCDDLWWEGDHTHFGPVGSGCCYVSWFGLSEWDVTKTIAFAVEVIPSAPEDEPVMLTPVREETA